MIVCEKFKNHLILGKSPNCSVQTFAPMPLAQNISAQRFLLVLLILAGSAYTLIMYSSSIQGTKISYKFFTFVI